MPTEILMPALSPTMEEGTLARWLVKEGDTVSSGDLLAEIETDKATMEFEAVEEGVIGKLLVTAGSEGVKVNSPIAVLLAEGEVMGAAPDSVAQAPAPEPDSPVVSAADETPAKGYGRGVPRDAPAAAQGARIIVSPLARRIAGERGIDLAGVRGSGPKGRIVKADIEAFEQAPAPVSRAKPGTAAPAARPAEPDTGIAAIYAGRPHTQIALNGMRKTIAARLSEAKQTIPHFYLRRDIHLDSLLALRAELNRQLARRDIKLSVNDFIIKACALALQQVPTANAVWAGDRLLQLTPSDVAVAVAIEGGLFTPVIKDAEVKSLSALSAEMKDFAIRARDRKLAPHEYQGGSFAISNLGMFGIDNFDAVINPPHGAILAVGAGVKKPVVNAEGQIVAATVMSVTLSVDHRVIDGALGAELLNAIKDNLENPMAMLA